MQHYACISSHGSGLQVAANAGSNCGSSGTSVCTSDDITISSYSRSSCYCSEYRSEVFVWIRRTISVIFTVGMYNSDSADTAVSTLSSYMGSTTFATDLVAMGGGEAAAVGCVQK